MSHDTAASRALAAFLAITPDAVDAAAATGDEALSPAQHKELLAAARRVADAARRALNHKPF